MTALNSVHTIKETYLRYGPRILSIFTNNEDFIAKFEELKNTIEDDVKNTKANKFIIEELRARVFSLKDQIEKFNSSRHCWERKLKIKE
jgi:hypothetical protein